MKQGLVHDTILFKANGEDFQFDVVHNLNDFNLDIEAAFLSWYPRAKNFTIQSFCNYVVSKDNQNIRCITKKRYNELLKQKKSKIRHEMDRS